MRRSSVKVPNSAATEPERMRGAMRLGLWHRQGLGEARPYRDDFGIKKPTTLELQASDLLSERLQQRGTLERLSTQSELNLISEPVVPPQTCTSPRWRRQAGSQHLTSPDQKPVVSWTCVSPQFPDSQESLNLQPISP